MLHTLAGAAWHGQVWTPWAELSLFVVSLFWTCWECGRGKIVLIVRTGITFFKKLGMSQTFVIYRKILRSLTEFDSWNYSGMYVSGGGSWDCFVRAHVSNRSSSRSKGDGGRSWRNVTGSCTNNRILTRSLESESAEFWVRVLEPGVWKQSSHMTVCAGEQDFVSNVASERDLRNMCFFFQWMQPYGWFSAKETTVLFKSNIYLAQEEKSSRAHVH